MHTKDSTRTLQLRHTYISPAYNPRAGEEGGAAVADNAEYSNGPSTVNVILPTPRTRPTALMEETSIEDDRNEIRPGDRVLLIVEDDVTFAQILLDMAHERDLKAVVALQGSAAISLAREFKPGAITLDISLP